MHTICLLIQNSDERSVLKELLAQHYAIVEATDTFPETSVDICITDSVMLDHSYSQLKKRKNAESPIFFPILFATDQERIGNIPQDLWDTIDEVIGTPVSLPELLGRIRILLRVRLQTQNLHHDLIEIANAKECLRAALEKFDRFVKANVIGIFIGGEHGEIIDANKYFLNLIGYTIYEVRQNNIKWNDLTPKKYLKLDLKAIEECKFKGMCIPYEKEFCRREGGTVWVTIGVASLHEQKQFVSFVLDISEKRNAEKVLRQSEQRFRALATAGFDVVYSMNPDWSEMLQLSGQHFLTDTTKPRPDWLQGYIPQEEQPRDWQLSTKQFTIRICSNWNIVSYRRTAQLAGLFHMQFRFLTKPVKFTNGLGLHVISPNAKNLKCNLTIVSVSLSLPIRTWNLFPTQLPTTCEILCL